MISTEDRLKAFSVIMKEVDEVVRLAGQFPGLRERLSLGAQGFMLVAPSETDKDTLTSFYSSSPLVDIHSLKIYPAFPGDEEMIPVLTSVLIQHDRQYACYLTEYHQITLSMESDETPRAMALFFIHELGHCLSALRSGRAMTKQEAPLTEKIAEEMQMRTFDYQLLLAIGGSSYRQEAEGLAGKIAWSRLNSKRLPLMKGRGAALDTCLGPPRFPAVEEKRDDYFWFHCELMAIDNSLPQDLAWAEKMKLVANYIK